MEIKKKVLFVEDEVISSMNIGDMLEFWGYDICTPATSAEEAIAITEAEKPDIVLLDIKLQGGMNGIELAGEIKKRLDVPIIFMTGYLNRGFKEKAAAFKPVAYLIKPFELNELKSALESACRSPRSYSSSSANRASNSP